ncbi:MAG: hypothetical protein ACJA0U_000957 [Salibacteraceae bacterium]|jgi:hypothetical protein
MHIGALTALGILMISQPHLFDEVDEGGRKAAVKWVFSYIWGMYTLIFDCGVSYLALFKKKSSLSASEFTRV